MVVVSPDFSGAFVEFSVQIDHCIGKGTEEGHHSRNVGGDKP